MIESIYFWIVMYFVAITVSLEIYRKKPNKKLSGAIGIFVLWSIAFLVGVSYLVDGGLGL